MKKRELSQSQPGPKPLADAVYTARGMNVALTMVNEQIIHQDDKFTTFDESEVKRKAMESDRAM